MGNDTTSITSPVINMTLEDMQRSWNNLGNEATANAGGRYSKLTETSKVYTGKTTEYTPNQSGYMQKKNFQEFGLYRLAPLDWTDDQKAKFVNQGIMNKAPGFDVSMGMPEILSAWEDLIKSADQMNRKDPDNPTWTPDDVLGTYSNPKGKYGTVRKGDWEYDIATGEKIKYVGPLSKTTTNTTIDKLSREDALALAKNSMSQMLGRAPTNGEVANYLDILNGYSAAHPGVSTTTTDIDPETGEARNSTTVNTGGTTAAGKQALLEEQIQKNPEYGAYQAATTGMGWLMQMVNGGR